jgi:uncharacterized membrane protein YbhN (UPF0104 family)
LEKFKIKDMVNGKELFADILKHHRKYIYVWIGLGLVFSLILAITLLFVPGDVKPFLPTVIAAFSIIAIITLRQVRQELKSIKKVNEIIKELK